MDNLSQKMKEIPEAAFPANLHGKIMRRLLLSSLKKPFLLILSLSFLNLLTFGWHIWAKMLDIEGLALLQDVVDGFQISYSSSMDAIKVVTEFFPMTSIVIFTLNILLTGYLAYLYVVLTHANKQRSNHYMNLYNALT